MDPVIVCVSLIYYMAILLTNPMWQFRNVGLPFFKVGQRSSNQMCHDLWKADDTKLETPNSRVLYLCYLARLDVNGKGHQTYYVDQRSKNHGA